MFRLWIACCFVASIVAYTSFGDCGYSDDNTNIGWDFTNDNVEIRIWRTNFNITNRFTGVAFGDRMNEWELMLVVNHEKHGTRFATGYTLGRMRHIALLDDKTPTTYVARLSSSEDGVSVTMTRPLKSTGDSRKDLSKCTNWHIMYEGVMTEIAGVGRPSRRPISLRICPEKCRD